MALSLAVLAFATWRFFDPGAGLPAALQPAEVLVLPPESVDATEAPGPSAAPEPSAAAEPPMPSEPVAPPDGAGASGTAAAEPPAPPEATPADAPAASARRAPAERATSRRAPAAATTGSGLLTIGSAPRAQVLIDGVTVGYTPYFQQKTSAGSHVVKLVTDDGRTPKSFRVTVTAGEETRKIWLFDEERWE